METWNVCKTDLSAVDERGTLRWFERAERMNENMSVRIIYSAKVNARRIRGCLRQIIESGYVKSQNNSRVYVNVNVAKSVCENRIVWRSIFSAYPCGKKA